MFIVNAIADVLKSISDMAADIITLFINPHLISIVLTRTIYKRALSKTTNYYDYNNFIAIREIFFAIKK
jgi:hypothetical protein